MIARMWRAFWVAMREPVRRFAPDYTLTMHVVVDTTDAQRALKALHRRAEELRKVFPEEAR